MIEPDIYKYKALIYFGKIVFWIYKGQDNLINSCPFINHNIVSESVIDFFATDNYVLISRISALFDAENLPFMVLGNHASLFGGGIAGISQRMMISKENIQKAVQLIREINLEKEISFAPGLDI